MELEQRGLVLPFRPRAPRPGAVLPSGQAEGVQIVLGRGDQEVNAEWNLFIGLATQAWSWRDPDSLEVLEQTVARLRECIARDWR